MEFPIVLKKHEHFRDPGQLFYEVAANGLFQVRETATHRAVTKVEGGIPGLLPERERVDLRFPPLPATLLIEVIAFFDEIYRRHRGEGIVILFFDPAREEFRVGVPPQKISGYTDSQGRWRPDYRLRYGNVARPEGFVRFGSIHSHASLAAYASHTDCEDEKFEDGLHVVFGSFASETLTRSASYVANGRRFHVDADDVLEACEPTGDAAPVEWMAQVECVEERWWSWSDGGSWNGGNGSDGAAAGGEVDGH